MEVVSDEILYKERRRLLFFGLPWTFTVYTITSNTVSVKSGLLNTVEDDCYMYKVQDVKLTTSLFERLFGLSTVVCYTGDVTHSELVLSHIKNGKQIKEFLVEASEQARIKRRAVLTNSIDADID